MKPLLAAALLVTAACSHQQSGGAPSATFNGDMTPGMSGHGTTVATNQATPSAPTGSQSPAPQSGTAVSINNFKFDPATLTVPVGATVTWTNQDEEPHTVVAKDGSFHSPGMDTHGTYSFTFTNAGTYDYVCSIHPFMTGTVVVTK
ncbi:MAG: cupredoxin family copper-binding protein [Mycobacteriaceae bacterium]|nr:cupredoxin family copper-binding protein [Mycobacteriaceae bacterium]